VSEICSDERALQRVLTDIAQVYRCSFAFRTAVLESGAVQRFTQPWHPQTNGKVERFNRTLLEEWAYVRPYPSNQRRAQALTAWLHIYNYHRAHTSLGQLPPISRLNNVSGYYSSFEGVPPHVPHATSDDDREPRLPTSET
jgi:transposase InsO family protein